MITIHKKSKILLITTLIFFLNAGVFLTPKKVYAQVDIGEVCAPGELTFETTRIGFPIIDLRKTVIGIGTTLVSDAAFLFTTGASMDQTFRCIDYINQRYEMQLDIPEQCRMRQEDQAFCEGLFNASVTQGLSTPLPEGSSSGVAGGTNLAAGSLVGMNNMLEASTRQSPPVSLAYFLNKQVEKVPFVRDTALAQSGAADYRNAPLVSLVFDFWEIARNAALGIMSVILIILGIMVMTRRKINPQTMVTVQYAIPKVVIALILIFFSYAIGATMASIGWSLRGSVRQIIISLGAGGPLGGDLVTWISSFPMIFVILITGLLALVLSGGTSIALTGFLAIGILVSQFFWWLILLKMALIYFKMLTKIVIAPLQFAFSAIPGYEDHASKWFKEMLAHILSLFAMQAIMFTTKLILAVLMIGLIENVVGLIAPSLGFDVPQSDFRTVIGVVPTAFFMPLFGSFIAIYGYYQAWKVPKKIEEALIDTKGGKRR